MKTRLWPRALALAPLLSILLVPAAALSLELHDGNAGYGGTWLHVIGSTAMTNRVYWQDLDAGVTYEVEFASDESFASPILSLAGITDNFVSPGLAAGSYVFRVRDSVVGAWSATGTLDVVEDFEAPLVAVNFPVEGQAFASGETIAVQLTVADDTVLHLAQINVDGQFAGVVGLQTVDYKLAPSFGEPRSVVFDLTLPAGGSGHDIAVLVSDVTFKTATATVHIGASGGGATTSSKKGGRKR